MSGSLINLGGRPRKPTATKALEGTLRPDRTNPHEPRGEAISIPDPPDHLSAPERRSWAILARVVDRLRVTTLSDLDAFESMVTCHAAAHLARTELFADGAVTETEIAGHGGTKLKVKPAFTALVAAQKLLLAHYSRFGLSPGDRSRVSVLGEHERDDLDEFA